MTMARLGQWGYKPEDILRREPCHPSTQREDDVTPDCSTGRQANTDGADVQCKLLTRQVSKSRYTEKLSYFQTRVLHFVS